MRQPITPLARRLRQLRLAMDLSQVKISRIAGMTPQAWNNAETGDNILKVEHAIKLYSETGIHLHWMYCGVADASLPPDFRTALIRLSSARLS